MSQKRLLQVDAETGEVIEDGFVAYIAPKRKNGFTEGWLAMSQGSVAIQLAKSKNLDGDSFRVFLALLAHLEHENYVLTPQSQIAESIGMQRSHFSRALKKLESEKVVLRGPKIGRMVSFKLNPEYAWKGSAQNHQKALSELRSSRMKAARISGVVEGGRRVADAVEHDEKTLDLFDA